ncbi:hypothetical protein [Micromonospora sp. NPDC005087]|uniref:hypothetical protein n=1 Tax=Micromonospora sp. NPDC005087 TaxID=3364225 RepID=UPI0036877B24
MKNSRFPAVAGDRTSAAERQQKMRDDNRWQQTMHGSRVREEEVAAARHGSSCGRTDSSRDDLGVDMGIGNTMLPAAVADIKNH